MAFHDIKNHQNQLKFEEKSKREFRERKLFSKKEKMMKNHKITSIYDLRYKFNAK